VEKHEQIYGNRKQIFFNNFLGGIAWALGVTVGLSAIIVIIGFILKNVNLIPFLGRFVSAILTFVLQNNPHLIK